MLFAFSLARLASSASTIVEQVHSALDLPTIRADRSPTLSDYHSSPSLAQAVSELWAALFSLLQAIPTGWIMLGVFGLILLNGIGQAVTDQFQAAGRRRRLRSLLATTEASATREPTK